MRVNIFTKQADDSWECYVQSATRANAERIRDALEAEGEEVRLFTDGRTIGRLIYETPLTTALGNAIIATAKGFPRTLKTEG